MSGSELVRFAFDVTALNLPKAYEKAHALCGDFYGHTSYTILFGQCEGRIGVVADNMDGTVNVLSYRVSFLAVGL